MHIDSAFSTTSTLEYINEEDIQVWLVAQIAKITGLQKDQIDIAQAFSSYGIDSVAAAALSGELANWLGVQIAPTITWDYPSVRLLAQYLTENSSVQYAA